MTRIIWDDIGARTYHIGIDRGVLYVPGHEGVPWNGLTSITEKPSGGTISSYYIDGVKYASVSDPEEFAATITAFTYPDEFGICDGSRMVETGLFTQHQPRAPFHLTYRTGVGNDVEGSDFAYKIHLIYNAMAAASEVDHRTISDDVDIADFSWDISALPAEISGFKNTAHFIIDSRVAHTGMLLAIEAILYGDESNDPRMATLEEVLEAIELYADLRVIDNGDGSFTIIGPETAIELLGGGEFSVDWPSVVILDPNTYKISSL